MGSLMFFFLFKFHLPVSDMTKYMNKNNNKCKQYTDIIAGMINIVPEKRTSLHHIFLTLDQKTPEYRPNLNIFKLDIPDDVKKICDNHISRFKLDEKVKEHSVALFSIVYDINKNKNDLIRSCIIISSKLYDDIKFIRPEDFSLDGSIIKRIIKCERNILKFIDYKIPVV